jgi:hypothetical protein
MFWRNYKDKQLFCGHNVLTGVFVALLFSNAGISVWRIVWITTNCRFVIDISHLQSPFSLSSWIILLRRTFKGVSIPRMKAYGWAEIQRRIYIGTRWRRMVSFALFLLYPWGKSARCSLDRKLGGFQSWSWRGVDRILRSHQKSNPNPASPMYHNLLYWLIYTVDGRIVLLSTRENNFDFDSLCSLISGLTLRIKHAFFVTVSLCFQLVAVCCVLGL